jgi:hypothetical protein
MVKRTMNGKRLLFLAAIAAFVSAAMPSAHAATTGNVVVKWNTLATGSLTIATNYKPGVGNGLNNATAGTIVTNANGGTGTCTGTSPTNVNGTVDFGNVSADPTHVTNCQFSNAVNVVVGSTDTTGWNVSEQVTAGSFPGGDALCIVENGTWAFNNNTNPASLGTALSLTSTCTGAGNFAVLSASPTTIFTPTAGQTTTAASLSHDLNLVLAANATTGNNQTVTITYTLNLL